MGPREVYGISREEEEKMCGHDYWKRAREFCKNQPKEIITREQAWWVGYLKYFTGLPCKYGHIDFRYRKSNECVECKRLSKYNFG